MEPTAWLQPDTRQSTAARSSLDKHEESDSEDMTATVPEAAVENRAPAFTEGANATRAVAENSGAGVSVGLPITATDPDGGTLTYSLSGTDAASFAIDAAGQLTTISGVDYDYEAQASYSVTVEAAGTADDGTFTISFAPPENPRSRPLSWAGGAYDGPTWALPSEGSIGEGVEQLSGGEGARLMHQRSDTMTEDAMIAATAIVHRLTVATRNVSDFDQLGGPLVDWINLHPSGPLSLDVH